MQDPRHFPTKDTHETSTLIVNYANKRLKRMGSDARATPEQSVPEILHLLEEQEQILHVEEKYISTGAAVQTLVELMQDLISNMNLLAKYEYVKNTTELEEHPEKKAHLDATKAYFKDYHLMDPAMLEVLKIK